MYEIVILFSLLIFVLILINSSSGWLYWIYPGPPWTDEEEIWLTKKKNRKAVLFVHEFSGTPASVLEMGKHLHSKGWDVKIPAMPGATCNEGRLLSLTPVFYRDWVRKAEEALQQLIGNYDIIVLAGASLGGSIGLELAGRYRDNISGIVTLASPVRLTGSHFKRKLLRNAMIAFSGVLSLFMKTTRTGRLRPEGRKLVPLKGIEGVLVLPAVHSHKVGLRRLRRRLKQVNVPLLSMHVRTDRTVDVYNQSLICKKVDAPWMIKKTWDVKKDGTRHHHLWSHKNIAPQVFQEVESFLDRIAGEEKI